MTPTQVLTDAAGGLSAVAVDSAGNIYAIEHAPNANSVGSFAVVEFASSASGAATPIRRIAGSNTGLTIPDGLAVDANGGIYVAQAGTGVSYFAPAADGNVAPLRAIGGSATGLGTVSHIAVNASGELALVNLGQNGYSILQFAAGSNGDVAPERVLESFPFGTLVDGLTYDALGDLYVASTVTTVANNIFTSFTPTIQEYAQGSLSIVRTITPPSSGLRVAGMQFDPTGNLYAYAENLAGQDVIVKFAATASGAMAPEITMALSSANNADGTLAIH